MQDLILARLEAGQREEGYEEKLEERQEESLEEKTVVELED